jgi:nucleoside-diphosphate-sugar epimerase
MSNKKLNILVCGAGGFIAGHLVRDLLDKGHNVIAADIKPRGSWYQDYVGAKNHYSCDLRTKEECEILSEGMDRVYNLACNMGGMGFIQNNHALCMESVLIQTHMLIACRKNNVKDILYSSSACIYPLGAQTEIKDSEAQGLKESDAYPANPEDGYGWEKLFSEILTDYFRKDFNINPRVCRFHNVYGPHGTWDGGREKAPAAICRKVITAKLNGGKEIEIWGDGEQTRSFMYVDDCITGMDLLWESDFNQPINLGSDEMVSINQLVDIVEDIAGIKLRRKYLLDKPQGVRGRNSDNTLIKEVLGWAPSVKLREGMEQTYKWILEQINNEKKTGKKAADVFTEPKGWTINGRAR